MSYQSEYFISPRAPGVRPADPPDYDGITFVYLFTTVLDPWIVPPQLQNVVLVVDNAQGFVAGMSIIIEGAGSFEVVSTDALNRMTVENLGYVSNAAPGASIAPGKITTTSLPGPKGDTGPTGPTGPGSTVTAGTTTTSPAGQNANVVNSGTPTAAIFDFTIPRGLMGPQGAQGPPGQAYSNTTTAAFTAAAPGTAQTLSLQSTTGLFAGVTLNINPIGYYQVTGVVSGTQVTVVNNGTPSNAAAGTVAPSGSPVLGTGPQGPPGISATLTAGNTTTIAPGSQAAVTARGTPSAQIFDFAIPAGVTGAQGPAGTNGAPGAPGAAATLNVGTTTTSAPGTPASVTASGTPSAQIFDFVVPQGVAGVAGAPGSQGPPGAAGAPGPAGAAATLTAGTTSTGAPGSNAAVTAVGTTSAQVFNFVVPRGDVGIANSTLAGSFTVPPVGQTAQVNVVDASWIVVGQMVYIDQAGGGPGQAGALQVQSKSGNLLTLLNPQPPPAIPSASTSQSGLLAQLSGNSTDYVGGDNACHSIAAISAFVTKTSAYTLTPADSGKYIICSGGSWTLTLPAPVVGLNYRLRNDMGISGTTGTITLQPNGGTIDVQASISLLPQQECTLITDGTNWRTHGLKREVILGTQDITVATASGIALLPSGYRLFELHFTGLQSVTADVGLSFQLSSDGGNTWVTAGNYYYEVLANSAATTPSAVSNLAVTQGSLGSMAAVGPYGQSKLTLYPGVTGQGPYPNWNVEAGYFYSTGSFSQKFVVYGYCVTAGPMTALKYYASSGNLANLHLTVKGIA
jgi:hypothetical protein